MMSYEGTAESLGAAGPSVDECFDVLEALFGAQLRRESGAAAARNG
jgi:hypothetical protein